MLRRLKDVEQYKVSAVDGELGSIVNFVLDDEQWAVRYLEVATGGPLAGRNMLISPMSLGEVDWADRNFHLTLTLERIKHGAGVSLHRPVSRQNKSEGHVDNRHPYDWGSSWLWGSGAVPWEMSAGRVRNDPPLLAVARVALPDEAEHLRSVAELRGYHVQGTDGGIGHVDDLILDDVSWRLPYLVIDTSDCWAGHKVLVAPHWAGHVDWMERNVYLDMSREGIKTSPVWILEAPISHEYEERLSDFYGRPAYWVGAVRPQGAMHHA